MDKSDSPKQSVHLPPPQKSIPNQSPSNTPKIALPPPSQQHNSPRLSPTKMDADAMDIHIRQRVNSLDALVRDQIVDDSSDEEIFEDLIHLETKFHDNASCIKDSNDKLIALVNGGSGARKGWILAQDLKKHSASVYNLKDLAANDMIRSELASELSKYQNKCLVIICGGDGSIAWAASLIDQSIRTEASHIPFPTICVFPMGTGNDLSRSLGWGSLEPAHKNIIDTIADIHFCSKITKRWSDLDRWRVTYSFDSVTEHNLQQNDMELDVHPSENKKYEITPPKQFYIQQHSASQIYKTIHTFDPPLPSTFLCYLSIGYDALTAYKFEQDRREHPERFNNQMKNQMMYVKHGFSEFFKPSDPITNCVELVINNKIVSYPENCRSLKLININSAMNGIFFWGNGKSRDFEYQQQHPPRLDDGKIEVMATRGVHDMLTYRVNITHAERISQCNDVLIRFKQIPKHGIALQIDGEAWIIKQECSLRVQIHDKLPAVIGYNEPRGVQSWLQASLDDAHIVKAKNAFRNKMRKLYKMKSGNRRQSSRSQSPIAPVSSGDEKEQKTNIVDKIISDINQSSSQFMSIFNMNKSKSPSEEIEMDEMKKTNKNKVSPQGSKGIPGLNQISAFLNKTKRNGSKPKTQDEKPESINFNEYAQNEPMDIDVDESESESKRRDSGLFLDRFAWWKATREKNHSRSIDAEAAHDAIANNEHYDLRQTQSCSSLETKKKRRSTSLI